MATKKSSSKGGRIEISADPIGPQLKKEVAQLRATITKTPAAAQLAERLDRLAALINVAQI